MFFRDSKHHYSASSTWFAVSISVVFSLLSLSRSSALYYGKSQVMFFFMLVTRLLLLDGKAGLGNDI